MQVPIPSLKKDEVLVKVKAASINQGDMWIQKGFFRPFLPKFPFIPGIWFLHSYRSEHVLQLTSCNAHAITMGHRLFAVCQGHTAKPLKPTAKGLPCAAHGNQPSAKGAFAVCFFSGTRQNLCRVPLLTLGKFLGMTWTAMFAVC